MSSPGQRRGSCEHAMAGFDTHSKCARCRDKGLADDPCVLKKECVICKGFTPEQTLQLATPTYRDRKEKKTTSNSTTSSTPLSWTQHTLAYWVKWKRSRLCSRPLPRRQNIVSLPSRLPARRDLQAVDLQLKILSNWMTSGHRGFPDLRRCC